MSFRSSISIITVILLALVIFFGRHEILHAWQLLGRVNLWILALIVPIQLFSYYATGGMIFSYLRAKGDLKTTSHWSITRMALELNFVNHVIPSGGAAGFSYLGWVLSRRGVSPGRAAMAQIIRFALTFAAFIGILIIAVFVLALNDRVNRIMVVVSLALIFAAIIGGLFALYVIGSKKHLTTFSIWITKTVNRLVRKVTRGKKRKLLDEEKIIAFFMELHQDYISILHDKRILIKPFIWAILTNIADVSLLFVAFLSLGSYVDPAILFVAFGVAGASSIISVTPGGAGIYEAVMIAFLATAGVASDVAIAGTLLARVTLLLGTIVFGYAFYQLSIIKYGKVPSLKKNKS